MTPRNAAIESDRPATRQRSADVSGDDLTKFKLDILAIIAGFEAGTYRNTEYAEDDRGRPHGLAIKTALEGRYRTDINHGRLYPNLDTLVEQGLVTKEAADKRTNFYGLSETGQRVIRDRRRWLTDCLGDDDTGGGDGTAGEG